jgi:hypothetical protein
MTITETITELRSKAKELNLDVDVDDEDLIIRALTHLESELPLHFDEIEDEEEEGLTEQQRTDYLNSSSECPYCHSENISADRVEADGESAFGDVECEDCGKKWRDVYTLTDVEDAND